MNDLTPAKNSLNGKKKKSTKMIKQAIALSLLVLSLPMALGIMKLRTNLAPKADVSSEASTLKLLSSSENIVVGQQFQLDVSLANGADMAHVVTGVDAIIKYDQDKLDVVEIKNGQVFDSLTQENIDQDLGQIKISGAFSKIKDEVGNPVGYPGNGDVFASVIFKPKKTGKSNISLIYNGGQDTSDSNIIAFKKGVPVAGQMPVERFLVASKAYNFDIQQQIAVSSPRPSAPPNCIYQEVKCIKAPCEPILVCPTPKPSIQPTPSPKPSVAPSPVVIANYCQACSYAPNPNTSEIKCATGFVCQIETPKCITDKNGRKICPQLAIAKGAMGLCVKSGQSVDVCNQVSPKPTPKPSIMPSPTPSPRPEAKVEIKLSMLDRDNNVIKGALYGVEVELSRLRQVSIVSNPNGGVAYQAEPNTAGEKNVRQINPPIAIEATSKGVVGTRSSVAVKIADFTTDKSGVAQVVIPQQYEGKRMQLYVRTPSHLKGVNSAGAVTLPKIPTCAYIGPKVCKIAAIGLNLEFKNLVPGDIFIADGESEQDNTINTFDAIDLIKSLGASSLEGRTRPIKCIKEPCADPKPVFITHKADLNGDGVVNTRDLKILTKYMGSQGGTISNGSIEEPIEVSLSCGSNADCQAGYFCYQPPMPTCPEGKACAQMMPAPYCKKAGGGAVACKTTKDCQPWQACILPPEPSCPPGATCMKALSTGFCQDLKD